MAAAKQAAMAMIVADFDSYHAAWDAAGEERLEVAAGDRVRLLHAPPDAEFWRVALASGDKKEGLIARACALSTSGGGKGDWGASGGSSIAAAVGQGLTSENFNLQDNVDKGDQRLVDPAVLKMEVRDFPRILLALHQFSCFPLLFLTVPCFSARQLWSATAAPSTTRG